MSRRSWSATAATSRKSGPRAPSRVTISSTSTSSPARHAVEHLADRRAGPGRPARWDRRREQRGRRDVAARGPGVVAREALEVGRAAHREAHVVVQPAVAVAHVLGVDGEARRERLARGLGGVDAARRAAGQGRSGFTWSGVTGETPPQSSMPAATSAARSSGVGQVGRRLQVDRRVEHQPGGGDRPEELVAVARGACATSTCPAWAGSSGRSPPARGRGARGRRRWRASASSRSARVSPMPTRIPVVNGIAGPARGLSVASRRSGVLSGAPACGPPGSPSRAASVSIIIPCDGDTARSRASSSCGERAGVGVGEQAGLGRARRRRAATR